MAIALRGGRVSQLILWKVSNSLLHLCQSLSNNRSTMPLAMRLRCSFSSIDGGSIRLPVREEQVTTNNGDVSFDKNNNNNNNNNDYDNNNYSYEEEGRLYRNSRQNPPNPIPNRPLRGESPIYQSEHLSRNKSGLGGRVDGSRLENSMQNNKPPFRVGGNRTGPPQSPGSDLSLFDNDDGGGVKMKKFSQSSQPQPLAAGKGKNHGDDFLEKFKLGFDKGEKALPIASTPQLPGEVESKSDRTMPEPPQDADEIFKKMKETGLIPNAVAMLDGLCKDGLVQEAMKLFGLMREKGTIPEVVIYTAVVDGFCKAQKPDDAKRIFRKMQNNEISPNAFSYTVLIQGLCKSKRLDDALDFCVEMLEAGHSPNLATFTGLVDGFCMEKGVEEAQNIIGTLRQKGFFFDEKAVREYLDKKGPFLPLVWEAIFGKKSSQRSF